MKTLLKIAVITTSLVLMFMADLPRLPVELVPEAEAVFGVRRRTHRRSVAVGYTAGAASATATTASASAAAAQQQSATAEQQSATIQQEAAPAAPSTPPPPASGKPLPLGTVVSALPAGCVPTPVGGVEYYYCGGNFFRAVFQGNTLVYVTTKPE
jgi:hypothetical protein